MNNIIINNLLIPHHTDMFTPILMSVLFLSVLLSVIRAKAGVRYE